MSTKQTENDDAAPIVMGSIVQLDIREHVKKIKEIRDLLIIMHDYQYENDAVIVETALEIGLKRYSRRLNRERDLISPF
jgi:quinolinate synthase